MLPEPTSSANNMIVSNDTKNAAPRPNLARLAVRMLGFAAIIVGAAAWYVGPGSFDRDAWAAHRGDDSSTNPRWDMRHELSWRYLRFGVDRAGVVDLLGEPDFEKTPSVYKYQLGMHSGFAVDEDSFDVVFDSFDQVIDTRVVQH